MNILITGGNGALALALRDAGKKSHSLYLPSHKDLDVTKPDQLSAYLDANDIDHVVHAAALTNLEYCESHPREAFLVNVLGTKYVAEAAFVKNIPITYISTEAVFSGHAQEPHTEDTKEIRPQNVYGWTKLMGEWWVEKINTNHRIIRLGWLFGPDIKKDKKFVTKIAKLLLQNRDVKAISDIHGSPTYSMDAASEILNIMARNSKGLFHVANRGVANRYDLALAIKESLGSTSHIVPVSHTEFPSTIDRALYSAMDTLHKEHKMRLWKEALNEYLFLQRESLENEI